MKKKYNTEEERIEARRKRQKKYRDKDEVKVYQKEYHENNKDKIKLYSKKYHENNKDKIKKQSKEWRENNKDYMKAYGKEWRKNNKAKIKEDATIYYQKNKEIINKRKALYQKNRRNSDPLYKLSANIRSRTSNILRDKGFTKKSKIIEIIGCSFEEFKKHIESQWEPWMDWDNYGKYNGELDYGWDVDHIIKMSTALTEEGVIKLNHYTNLQPLCSYTNRVIKG